MTIIHHPFPQDNLCPVCNKEAIQTCRCMWAHSKCENGHEWHYDTWARKERKDDGRMHTVEDGWRKVIDKGEKE